jgi:hypothetical protein
MCARKQQEPTLAVGGTSKPKHLQGNHVNRNKLNVEVRAQHFQLQTAYDIQTIIMIHVKPWTRMDDHGVPPHFSGFWMYATYSSTGFPSTASLYFTGSVDINACLDRMGKTMTGSLVWRPKGQ